MEENLNNIIRTDRYLLCTKIVRHKQVREKNIGLQFNKAAPKCFIDILNVASKLRELEYGILAIEVPALSRIIVRHIYYDRVSRPKAHNIAVLLKQLSIWKQIF